MRNISGVIWVISSLLALSGSWAMAENKTAGKTGKPAVQSVQGKQAAQLNEMYKRMAIFRSLGNDEDWRKEMLSKSSDDPVIQRYFDWVKRYDQNVRGAKEDLMPGAVTSFLVSFPFECASILDFGHAFGPELNGFDTSKALDGAMYPALNWRLYTSVGNMSAVMPQEMIYNPGFVAIYLTSRIIIDSKNAVKATIEIPSVTPVIAWLNQKRVVESLEKGPDEVKLYGDRYEVELNPGENILVMKVSALEQQPGFFVFIHDASTGKPMDFKIDNERPIIVDGPLSDSLSAKKLGAVYTDYLKDDSVPVSDRAYMARLMLDPEAAQREINSLLMVDTDKTASLPDKDIEIAVLALDDPGKSLVLLNKAMDKHPGNARLSLLYARQLLLNSEAQGDTGSRFVDEWPQIQESLKTPRPSYDGISYEPLRQKILALSELNSHQVMSAKSAVLKDCSDCLSSIEPLIVNHLESRGMIQAYRQSIQNLYDLQKNSSAYFVEIQERALRHAVSSNDEHEISLALSKVQKDVEAFFELHPYDDFVWAFWLDVVSAYGSESTSEKPEIAQSRRDAGFNADADSWYLLYLTQRMNDPARWLRYARHCLHSGLSTEAVEAYDMAVRLMPQDESIAERASLMKKLANHDQQGSDDDSAFETPYIINDIPGNTDPTAAQIVSLLDNRVVRILPNGLSSTFNQIAFEVMDEQGLRSVRAMPINYSPTDEKLEIISVTTTKKDGTVRKFYKTSEYNTADESIRMYYDQRQLVIEVPDIAVGDRIEYRFKRTQMQRSASSAAYFSDIYQLRTTFNRQWSKYTVIAPDSMPVRLYRHDPNGQSEFTGSSKKVGGNTVTTYEEKNTPRLIAEDQMPGITEVMPFLLASSFKSWQSVADWFIDLAKPQWKADEAIKKAVADLTAGIDDPLEKLKKIHSFVVKSTRYVALEFGIHGHKPYPASQVFERRFGDCKDKASLLKVMLEEAGIKTHFVLLRTRQNGDISMELPNAYLFDHAIVYVPEFDKFIDGTAEFSGMNETPSLDQDATVFIVHDDASYELRKTPVSKPEDNLSRHEWTFDLTQGDSVPYTDHVLYHGLMAPSYRERYQVESLQKERLESEYAYSIPGTDIDSYEFSGLTDLEQDVTVALKAKTSFSEIVKKDGKTWLIRPGVTVSQIAKKFAPSATRKLPLIQVVPMSFEQTINLILPAGAQVVLPEALTESGVHGSWSVAAVKNDNILTTRFSISLNEIRINPKDYASYQDFLQRFDRALNAQYRIEIKEQK